MGTSAGTLKVNSSMMLFVFMGSVFSYIFGVRLTRAFYIGNLFAIQCLVLLCVDSNSLSESALQ